MQVGNQNKWRNFFHIVGNNGKFIAKGSTMTKISHNLITVWIGIFLLTINFITGCEKFPSNPPKVFQKPKSVFIKYLGTKYVPAKPPAEGLVATKVNVLFFKIRTENFETKTLEIYGRAVIQGPPDSREHSLYFETDSLRVNPKETGYTFNTLEKVVPGSTYTLVRAKFPTNEYSPFEGTQGKVKEVTITNVFAHDKNGKKFSVALIDSL